VGRKLRGLSVTVLYETGGRQQVSVPGPRSGRIQRREEIPEATQKMDGSADDKHTWDSGKTMTME